MKYFISKKPKGAKLILGFPSLGLVSTIATKFLIDHLDVEQIGKIESEHFMPLTAIHKSKLIDPITIYYNKKFNLVLIQSITEIRGLEWEIAGIVLKIARDLNTKEIVMLEGMPGHDENLKVYCYSNLKKTMKVDSLSEGVIMGLTAAILLKSKNYPVTCIFAETHSQLPDSEAAAKVVEALDNHIGFNIDSKPLMDAAKKFESSLKKYMEKMQGPQMQQTSLPMKAQKMTKQEKKELDYFG